jgi:endogenous inhibitor of DNA gyrase (YacG/DUF329 family)
MMTEIKCAVCDEPATWMRYTQFAGNHPFCDKHAESESDFNDGDWEKIKMTEVDLKEVQLAWSQDILVRIKTILDSKGWTDEQKLVSIAWLVKQGIKRDDD